MFVQPISTVIYGVELDATQAAQFHERVAALILAKGERIDGDVRSTMVQSILGWRGFVMAGAGADRTAHDSQWFSAPDKLKRYVVGFQTSHRNVSAPALDPHGRGGSRPKKKPALACSEVERIWAEEVAPALASVGALSAAAMLHVEQIQYRFPQMRFSDFAVMDRVHARAMADQD